MGKMINMWLLGMGILPEQIDDDAKLMDAIMFRDGLMAWERLSKIVYERSDQINARPEFRSAAAQLEFMSFVNGKPILCMN